MYKLVLGLEVHLHLTTAKKMFCGCNAVIFGDAPNSHTCPTCLGLPGALPVPNREAVEKTHLLGHHLGCKINGVSRFDRKHYFYPDLPKGYQISQYQQPLCGEGKFILDSGEVINIRRVHIEEDTAKSFHQGGKTLVDFNKSGAPLVEIVTEPNFKSADAAVEFCKKIQVLVRELGISTADMEKGQMRLEANISLRTEEMETTGVLPPYKVEVKNINSFKFMKKAVDTEIQRQSELMDKGQTPQQENRGWDEDKKTTVSQRDKEEAHDYRYFPEPDIPPMEFSREYIERLASVAPLAGPVKNAPISIARKPARADAGKVTDEVVLRPVVKKVLVANAKAVSDLKAGKISALQFLVGQAMRETNGSASAQVVEKLITEELKNGIILLPQKPGA